MAALAVVGATMVTTAHAQQTDAPSPFAPGQSVYFSDPLINTIISQAPLPPFDMETGNAVFGVIIPNLGGWIHQEVSPHFSDPSLSFRYNTVS